MMLTLRLCVLYGSHNKQRLFPYTPLADWFHITEVESIYSAVRTKSLYITVTFVFKRDTLTEVFRDFPQL